MARYGNRNSSCKVHVIFVTFSATSEFWTSFRKNNKYKITQKCPVGVNFSMRKAAGKTDRHEEDNSHASQLLGKRD
jgi:hypothetical protein